MHRFLTALAACIAAAQAFKGTSPFLFFSTAQLPPALQDASVAQIQTSRAVLDTTKEFLGSCPTEIYYIIHQPSVLPTDLTPSSIPNLQAALSSSTVKAKYLVSETRGLESDVKQELATHLRNACGEIKLLDQDLTIGTAEALSSQISGALKDGKKVLVRRTMEKLSGSRMSPQRAATLNEIDQSHKFELSTITAEPSYTIIWTTTPVYGDAADVGTYEPEFQDTAHMELKRDLGAGILDAKSTNATDPRPLFEKYQFFTPGLFMGLLTGVVLISILTMGLKAISSLQVSYAAFDKDMGPAAQKKQQ